jgi:hypothetical protein
MKILGQEGEIALTINFLNAIVIPVNRVSCAYQRSIAHTNLHQLMGRVKHHGSCYSLGNAGNGDRDNWD